MRRTHAFFCTDASPVSLCICISTNTEEENISKSNKGEKKHVNFLYAAYVHIKYLLAATYIGDI